MFARLLTESAGLQQIKPMAFTIGLATKTPLEKNDVLRGIAAFQTAFPQLTETDFNQKEDTVRVGNGETEYEKELLLRASHSTTFDFSWGCKASFGQAKDAVKVFDAIQDGFSMLPLNVALMDCQVHFICNWAGQHYAAIWETFFRKSPLYSLFDGRRILQDDLRFRALVTDEKIAIVNITSNVSDAEVKRGQYKGDRLKVSVGIACMKTLAAENRLSAVFSQHVVFCADYIADTVLRVVVQPLDKTIQSEVQRNEK